MHDDSKIGSELSYTHNERKTDFSEEQTDDNQRQRVEVMKDGRVATDQQMSERHHVSGDLIVVENQQISKEMNNNDTDFAPIVAYAQEPLLSLPEACAPLNDILYDLSVYVQLALDETPENPPDGLTIDE
ncbi:unnamed protein product, partial [Rotaria sp. Silwood1]